MQSNRHTLLILLSASTVLAFVMTGFLVPRGDMLAYSALFAALLGAACVGVAYSYAAWDTLAVRLRDDSLQSSVDRYTISGSVVPKEALLGEAALIAFVQADEVPHPAFNETLLPYFADSSLGFVQAATRYQGTGRVANAFRAQAALADVREEAAASINATVLRGSGSMIARDALVAAYRDNITLAELGARIEALGYTSAFESAPLVLAWAPRTTEHYWPRLVRQMKQSFSLVRPALFTRHLPLAARLQYLARPAGYVGALSGAVSVYLTFLALIIRGSGPVILSIPALPGLVISIVCGIAAMRTLKKLSNTPVLLPAALGFVGTGVAVYRTGSAVAAKIPTTRVWKATAPFVRAAIARVSGSGGSAPAGSPARL